jgi:serine/threonine-protein kinase
MADVRSDLYSLGCTFYFMLTGKPPFPEGTVLQKLLSHSSEQPSDPRHARPDLDEQFVKIINKLLAKKPVDRYQQPSELIGQLLLVADRLKVTGLSRSGRVWVTPRPARFSYVERSLPWLAPFALLVAVVFALDQFWSGTESEGMPVHPPKLKPAIEQAPVEPDQPEAGPEPASAEAFLPEPPPETTGGREADDAASEAMSRESDSPAPGPSPPAGEVAPPEATVPSPKERQPAAGEAAAGETAPTSDSDETTAEPSTTKPVPLSSSPPAVSGDPQERNAAETDAPVGDSSPVDRIIVAVGDVPGTGGAKVVGSLSSACLEAASLGVEVIELHFNGTRPERPLDVASRRLTIRNGPGFSPTVVFQPMLEDLSSDRQMIRVDGGQLDWRGVHLRLELPPEPAESWSLFHLKGIERLDVQDSVFTVCNVNEAGDLPQDRVAFFTIEELALAQSLGSEDHSAPSIPPHVGLSNCLARGEATLVRCEQASPFRIVCRQCLLVMSDRLIDIDGAREKPSLVEGGIDVVLKNVTAALGAGLCRLSTTRDAPHQLDLVTDSKSNIICVTDPKAAVIERRGVQGVAEVEKRLYIRGRDNFYLGSLTLLRINPSGNPGEYVDRGFDERNESWFQEESPRFTLMWETFPPPDLPPHRQTAEHYVLDASEHNPAIYDGGDTRAGVDNAALPSTGDESTGSSPLE